MFDSGNEFSNPGRYKLKNTLENTYFSTVIPRNVKAHEAPN